MRKKLSLKSKALTFLVLLVVSALCFALMEVLFRGLDIGEIQERETIWVKHTPFNPFLIFGPRYNTRFELKNGDYVEYNSQGFRLNYDVPLKNTGDQFRIIALGGSTTENEYPALAMDQLNKLGFGRNIQILNTGMSAYTTAHSLVRLQFDLLPFKPDMITVMHNINDLIVNYFPGEIVKYNYGNAYFNEMFAHRPSLKQIKLLRHSHVLVYLFERYRMFKLRFFSRTVTSQDGRAIYSTMMFSDKPINLELKEAFYNNLLGIVTIAKAHGIDVVLMTQPGKFSEEKIAIFCGHKPYNDIVRYPRQDEFRKHFQEYNDIIRKVAKEEAVHLIDMNRLFGQESDLYKDMVHYSQEGVKRFGKIYADQLEVILRKTGKAENTEY